MADKINFNMDSEEKLVEPAAGGEEDGKKQAKVIKTRKKNDTSKKNKIIFAI